MRRHIGFDKFNYPRPPRVQRAQGNSLLIARPVEKEVHEESDFFFLSLDGRGKKNCAAGHTGTQVSCSRLERRTGWVLEERRSPFLLPRCTLRIESIWQRLRNEIVMQSVGRMKRGGRIPRGVRLMWSCLHEDGDGFFGDLTNEGERLLFNLRPPRYQPPSCPPPPSPPPRRIFSTPTPPRRPTLRIRTPFHRHLYARTHSLRVSFVSRRSRIASLRMYIYIYICEIYTCLDRIQGKKGSNSNRKE